MKILVSKNKRLYIDDKFIVEGENKVDKLEFEFPSEIENLIKFIVISSDEGNYIDLIIDNEYLITRAISNLHNISIAVICTNSEIVSELTELEDLSNFKDEIEFRSLSVDIPNYAFLVDLDTVEDDNNPSAIARVLKKVLKNTEDIDTIKENQDTLKQNFENFEVLKKDIIDATKNMDNLKKTVESKLENGEFNGRDGKDGADGQDGKDGKNGIDGAKGEKGDKGEKGEKGDKGDPFQYEDFTEEQLASLKGEKGDKGEQGIQGLKGETGEKGDTGEKGNDGYTPQKGTDYYTEEDKAELINEIQDNMQTQFDKINEVEELSKNMPWSAVEGESIDIDDAHEYSKNSLKIYGNCKQESREGYQLIEGNYTNSINNDVNYIVNEDKTITANGTANSESDSSFAIFSNLVLEAGNYHFSGCPKSGSTSTYRINIWDNDWENIGIDTGNGISFTLTEEKTLRCSIMIMKGTTVNNLVFKPLLYTGTFDSNKKYEEFGAMPSPKFQSKIECVTSNIDIKKINNLSDFETESNRKNEWN